MYFGCYLINMMLSEELQGANDCYSHQETTTCHRATLAVKLTSANTKSFSLNVIFFHVNT